MKKNILILSMCVFLLSCGWVEAGIFSFKHTSALMLNQNRESVLDQAEHILKQPKDVVFYFEGEPDQMEARRYSFNNEYDIVLFFGAGVFLALDTIKPDSNEYPRLLHNFESLKKDSPLVGYILSKKANELDLQVLMK